MAITYVGQTRVPATDGATNQGTTVTFTPPTMQTGDFVLVYVATYLGSQSWSVTTTGGQTWTEVFDETRSGTHALYWCTFNGTWAANPVFTRTGATANDIMGWMVALRGVNSSAPWDVAVTTAADTNDQDFADFSTNSNGAWAVWGGFEIDNNTCTTNNGGSFADEAVTDVGWRVTTLLSMALARKEVATAGSAGATTLNYSANDAGGKWYGAIKMYVVVPTEISHSVQVLQMKQDTKVSSVEAFLKKTVPIDHLVDVTMVSVRTSGHDVDVFKTTSPKIETIVEALLSATETLSSDIIALITTTSSFGHEVETTTKVIAAVPYDLVVLTRKESASTHDVQALESQTFEIGSLADTSTLATTTLNHLVETYIGGGADTYTVAHSLRSLIGTGTDATYIVGDESSVSYEFLFDSALDPQTDENHFIQYRFKKVGGKTATLTASLYCDNTLIASFVESDVGTDWVTVSHLLTTGQAGNITDYSLLELKLEADFTGEGTATEVWVSGVQMQVPMGNLRAISHQLDALVSMTAALTSDVETFILNVAYAPSSIESLITATLSSAHDVEALALATSTAMTDVDALVLERQVLESSVDALPQTRNTSFSVVDALTEQTFGTSGLIEALIKQAYLLQAVLDAAVMKESALTWSVDTFVNISNFIQGQVETLTTKTISAAHDIDVYTLTPGTYTREYTLDALLWKQLALAHQVDALPRQTSTSWQSVQALLLCSKSNASLVETFTRRTQETAGQVDICARKAIQTASAVEVLVGAANLRTSSVEALLRGRFALTTQVATNLLGTSALANSVDADLILRPTISYLLEAIEAERKTTSTAVDSLIKKISTVDENIDALIRKTEKPASAVDALFISTATKSTDVNALIASFCHMSHQVQIGTLATLMRATATQSVLSAGPTVFTRIEALILGPTTISAGVQSVVWRWPRTVTGEMTVEGSFHPAEQSTRMDVSAEASTSGDPTGGEGKISTIAEMTAGWGADLGIQATTNKNHGVDTIVT